MCDLITAMVIILILTQISLYIHRIIESSLSKMDYILFLKVLFYFILLAKVYALFKFP